MQFLTCVLILFSTPVAKTRVAPFADGVMEAAIHKRCWKSLLSRQFPRWPYHREVLSDFIEGSVYQWSPADALLEDRQSTHRQNLSPHKPFNKGEIKTSETNMIRFLGFWCLHFSKKKLAESNVRLIFKCLTVMNSSCPMTHMTGMSEILTSYQPFHPRSHILWKRSRRYMPSRISFRMWYRASSCDTSSKWPKFFEEKSS